MGLTVDEIVRHLVLVVDDQENKTSPMSIIRVEYLEGVIYNKNSAGVKRYAIRNPETR